jgi:eukaryotic-like serine/threonine-protein kinase
MLRQESEISVQCQQAIDQLADRFEREFRGRQQPRIEDFLSSADRDIRPHLLRELLKIELELLRNAGEKPELEKYQQRFSDDRSIVESVFVPANVMASTIDLASDTNFERNENDSVSVIPGYQILSELGHGGMGIVFKAMQLQADRQVALKVMMNAGSARPEELARFHKEVQAAAKLLHPNIVQVYEVHIEGKYPYFTQEYVPGGTLANKIKHKLLPHSETAEMMLQICRAIAFAHEHGVIHRDLKPANILIGSHGAPKIADFGLARQIDDESKLTKDGTVLGTPSYMAPEQASGSNDSIGPRSDVYALGAILYELLAGRPPFKGATVWEVINLVKFAEPTPPL